MGILLQRGNAAILGNRIPHQPGAYIDGILLFHFSLSLNDDQCVKTVKYTYHTGKGEKKFEKENMYLMRRKTENRKEENI